MDPLSITVGVISLLAASVSTGTLLKDFYNGAALANVKVQSLLSEVDSFTGVLRLMRDTFEKDNIQISLRATGHISDHVANLATSIQDGQRTLSQLRKTLEKVNKSVNVLDGMRKHMRLKGAADSIAMYRQQIKSYRDTMHLTLQTIILWNQVSFRESTDLILPNLDYVHNSIRRVAQDINSQISSLQDAIETPGGDLKLHSLRNLRNCVKSSATIVSSASSTLSIGHSAEQISVTYASDFGDCFPAEPAEPMRRWISSKSVYEYEPERGAFPSMPGLREPKGKGLELIEEGSDAGLSDQSESDSELEAEIVDSLLRQGKDKLASQDFEAAENRFRNCLSRVDSNRSSVSLSHFLESRAEITALLLNAYKNQEKWDAARSLLEEEIALESRASSKDSPGALQNTLRLVEVLLKKFEYKEALSHGRRALKGYRRLGPTGSRGVQNSLELLCRISKASGNFDQEDAYAAILSDVLRQTSTAPPKLNTVVMRDDVGHLRRKPLIEKTLPMESSSTRGHASIGETRKALASQSGWKPDNQTLSPSASTSTKSSDRDTLSTQSRDPPSPYTEYSFTSSNSQEEQLSPKDIRGYRYEDERFNPGLGIAHLREPKYGHNSPPLFSSFIRPVQQDEKRYGDLNMEVFRNELNERIPAMMSAGKMNEFAALPRTTEPEFSDISNESEGSTTPGPSRSPWKSAPPPRPHKPKHLRNNSSPLPEEIDTKPAQMPARKSHSSPEVDQVAVAISKLSAKDSTSTEVGQKDEPKKSQKDKTKESQQDPIPLETRSVILPQNIDMRPPIGLGLQADLGSDNRAPVEVARETDFPQNVVVQQPTGLGLQGNLSNVDREPVEVAREIEPRDRANLQTNNQIAQHTTEPRVEPVKQPPVPLLSPKSAFELFDSGLIELPVEAKPRRRDDEVDWAAFYADQDARNGKVKRLMEMGFGRAKVVDALQMYNQDLAIVSLKVGMILL